MKWPNLFAIALLTFACATRAIAAVTVIEDAANFTLSNAHVTAKISKQTGDLISLRYKNLELMGGGSGHPYGYWSHSPGRNSKVSDSITIDPKTNNGQRAEVSIKTLSNGQPVGSGPGGSAICDIEIRYSLGADDSGFYTYSIFEHKPDCPATSIGEARFGAKLNGQVFDWMTIDARRNKLMPKPEDWDKGTQLNMKEVRKLNTGIYAGQVEHKYDYSAIQFNIPAFGWSSTKDHVGLWFVNPTIEYLSGGATKVELTGHLDNNAGAAPTLLNYWRGSHYGSSVCAIDQGEHWTKVIGPFLIYCNSASTPNDMWSDALTQAQKEAEKWPYAWVQGVDYPHKKQRGTVTGQILLNDPPTHQERFSNLLVGLAAPDYPARAGRGGRLSIDWQLDAKHYEFWARGEPDGKFSIPNIRPGRYTLHAIADGVLGEFAKTDIAIEPGKSLDIGRMEWTPLRYGRQLWEVGIPNRSGEEFRHGDHYWQWGLYNLYPTEFPNDVNFTIGKSDFHKDWNYAQLPRGDGKPTTWSINFDLPDAPRGKAMLRVALAATSARKIDVSVNDQPAGSMSLLMDTATIRRDGIRGYWAERDLPFAGSLMKAGPNVLKLTIPAGNPMNGVIYDYLRLELEPG